MKNHRIIAENLAEAVEQLELTIARLRSETSISEEEFQIELEHAYHHLNFAWNVRNESVDKVNKCSDSDFAKWSKFPVGEMGEYE